MPSQIQQRPVSHQFLLHQTRATPSCTYGLAPKVSCPVTSLLARPWHHQEMLCFNSHYYPCGIYLGKYLQCSRLQLYWRHAFLTLRVR